MMETTPATNESAPAIPLTNEDIQQKLRAFIHAVEEGNNDAACLKIIQGWVTDGHIQAMLMAKGSSYGSTALHRAAAWGETKTLKALLDAGEEAGILKKMLKHTDHEKRTVFDKARNPDIKEILQDAALTVALNAVSAKDQFDKISQDPDLKNACASHAIKFVKGDINEEALLKCLMEATTEVAEKAENQIAGLQKQALACRNLSQAFETADYAWKKDVEQNQSLISAGRFNHPHLDV